VFLSEPWVVAAPRLGVFNLYLLRAGRAWLVGALVAELGLRGRWFEAKFRPPPPLRMFFALLTHCWVACLYIRPFVRGRSFSIGRCVHFGHRR